MTYSMASITKKVIRGKPYYYARECKRVNGKPKIVWQKYLGRADDIVAAMTTSTAAAIESQPKEAEICQFGAVAALYDLSLRLKLVETIDRHVPKRGRGPSVGTYLQVASINRCVAPCSKASIAKWFQATALRRLVDIEARQLTSQRFWDNMDRVSAEAIARIESELTTHMVDEFELDLRRVLFDATNFFTFIDTFNDKCTVAQRGKSKEGRKALRIVGLALLVTADFHVPLLHNTYPGNQSDAPTFASLTDSLVARYKALTDGAEEITIVFDKGNNSQDNLEAVEGSPYHFVGSLVPTQHPELLKVSADRFRSLEQEGLAGVSAHRTTKTVFGVKRTVLVTYNENLFVAQSRTILREIGKRQQKLRQIQANLRRRREGKVRRGKPPTMKGTRKKIDEMMKAQHMKQLFHVDLVERDGLPDLKYRFDSRAWERLQRTLLGKTIIFTDQDHWSDADIIRGYRGQHQVETAFRTMKDPHHICLRPQHHWTDQKIGVHVFYCVLALMLCSLLRRELHHKGIERSIPAMLDELSGIHEVAVVYPPKGKKKHLRVETTVSKMSEDQRAIFDTLGLKRYLST
jgi:transposase